uniref:DUF19 domain-containing protein n=1 Tax=Trichobilharzia regenti TaxID=157069 RepID=A0AA85JUX0_TRIRE|nr:unnamed protein product [Trichobilharzia regenti]
MERTNASVKTVFVCFSVTVLLCLLNECKSNETHTECEARKQFETCLNKTKSDILNPTPNPEFDLSSMKDAVNMDSSDFMGKCTEDKICTVKTLLCYLGDQLKAEWKHCYDEEETHLIQTAYEYLESVRHTPMEFDLEKFSNLD